MNFTPVRLHIIAAMLGDLSGEWTVNRMAANLSARVDAPASEVRETFFLLMHERLAEAVPFQRVLTIRIRTDHQARSLLEALLRRWRGERSSASSLIPASAAEGGELDV